MRGIGEYTTAKYLFFTRLIHSQNFVFLSYTAIIWKKLNTDRMQEREPYQVLRLRRRRSFIKSVDLIYSFHRKNFPCQVVWRDVTIELKHTLCRLLFSLLF